MIQIGDRCCKNLLCAKSSQFSHVYVSPAHFKLMIIIQSLLKCSRGKLPSKPELLKLMIFPEYRNTKAEQSLVFFLALVTYHGDNLKISFSFAYDNHLPFTIFSHLRKTTRPTGARGIQGQSALSVILSSL